MTWRDLLQSWENAGKLPYPMWLQTLQKLQLYRPIKEREKLEKKLQIQERAEPISCAPT
jgi:hypothetical protein